jgi:predicted DNA-binding transcriptional regulator AlpA
MSNQSSPEMQWLTVADLAQILSLKRQTIYNRLSSHPDSLPPATRVPKLRGPRWSMRVVREWQAQYDPAGIAGIARHKGRPTKAETIAKRRLAASCES